MGDDLADSAQTDEKTGFLFNFKCFFRVADLPVAFPLLHIGFHHVLAQGKHQRDHMLGYAAVVGAGGDDDGDAALSGGVHIHTVVTDTRSADHLQCRRGIHGCRVYRPFIRHADDKSVSVLKLIPIVVRMRVVSHKGVPPGEHGHTLGAQRLGKRRFHYITAPSVLPHGWRNPWR